MEDTMEPSSETNGRGGDENGGERSYMQTTPSHSPEDEPESPAQLEVHSINDPELHPRSSVPGELDELSESHPQEANILTLDDDESELDDDGRAELIREATAAAIQDAIAMKRSDSFLSTESRDGDHDSDLERGSAVSDLGVDPAIPPPQQPGRKISRASMVYMEGASFEAAMLSPTSHRVAPSGRLGRQNTESSGEIVQTPSGLSPPNTTSDEDDGDGSAAETPMLLQRRQSEVGLFSSMSKVTNGSPGAALETVFSLDLDEQSNGDHDTEESVSRVLESCGMTEIESTEDAVLIHAVFQDFCNPPLDVDRVEKILEMERNQSPSDVTLPLDVVVHKPSNVFTKLIGPPILRLPKTCAMAFFRILLRLLTNESDAEYNNSIMATCEWYDDTFPNPQESSTSAALRSRTSSTSSLKKQSSISEEQFDRTGDAQKVDQMYTMVRLQRNWTTAVKQVLQLLESILADRTLEYLLGPVTSLLGLLCAAGVAVDELQKILSLASSEQTSPLSKLMLVRTLKTAAAGASRASMLVGKASPRTFFSFVSGPGIVRAINLEKSAWPFKNDFGMALWFRAEQFTDSSTLLRATDQAGTGTEVSLLPLSTDSKGPANATVLALSILEGGKVVHCIKVSQCILHERAWYHVAVRHTRSRLKGVFSLASREQVSVMLDGKTMLTEPLKFPNLQGRNSITLTFGANFDGQTGAMYVFHDNVSDATFKALHSVTAGTNRLVGKRTSSQADWDTRRGDIVRKSRVLDLNMRKDDLDDIVLSQRVETKESRPDAAVLDLDGENERFENSALSKAAFVSRLYVAWEPRRTEGAVALELHSGAHARMDPANVQSWTIEGAQDVISSIGGVQALLPICRALLSGDSEQWLSRRGRAKGGTRLALERFLLCSIIPELMLLFASFANAHNENSREFLRSGSIDMFEQLIHTRKTLDATAKRMASDSVFFSLSTFPSLSAFLVQSMLDLRSACVHYVGLETKVFSRLLFNLPLWIGGLPPGVSLYPVLIPFLSTVTIKSPEKVRDCIGVKDITKLLVELVEFQGGPAEDSLFCRDVRSIANLKTDLTVLERRHLINTLLAIIFQVLAVGSSADEISCIINMLSNYLESEWDRASKEISEAGNKTVRKGAREERYRLSLRTCTVLLFLFQTKPSPPHLFENFTNACGSVQAGAAWILSSMVNSFCDKIRAIGVKLIVGYVETTSRNPDLPLELEKKQIPDIEKSKSTDSRSLQENTLSLIKDVGQGLLNTNVGKGLAAIGPSVRSKLLATSHLTGRVIYKLLWHLLKSHRYRMGDWTQGSLVYMAFDRTTDARLTSFEYLKENLLTLDHVFEGTQTMDLTWAESIMDDSQVTAEASVRDALGINTALRLLRFLPDDYADQWLSDLARLCTTSSSVIDAVSRAADWQPCLFQFISELVESTSGHKVSSATGSNHNREQSEDESHYNPSIGQGHHEGVDKIDRARLQKRLEMSLELYALLLGHLVREGGERALTSLDDAASLQRVCLNGQEVFGLVLSRLFHNIANHGVISIERATGAKLGSTADEPSRLLKRGAALVTDAILSTGTPSMKLPMAVDCWRCLRHMTATTVAVSTRLGFGVAELFDDSNKVTSGIDRQSRGLFGIRLDDGQGEGIAADDLAGLYSSTESSVGNGEQDHPEEHGLEKAIHRIISVNLATQMLSLLDVFIFPDSLDVSVPTSQLHGLSLVRSTETRMGSDQGPLLTSLVRLSLVLLGQLEPCSVKLLQCSSRLRCFLHWILELIRESEALEGYSAAFNDLTAPFDRLILAMVLQGHRTLGRCAAWLDEIESTPLEKHFADKDSQKRSYRRLLRITLELRDILVTSFDQRNEVLRTCLSWEAFEALKMSLNVPSNTADNGSTTKSHSPKEVLVREFLRSTWVTRFQEARLKGKAWLPVQLQQDHRGRGGHAPRGATAMEELFVESNTIVGTFEKSLNACFEKYLEAQRKWAETGAVRDLEFEGDSTLKRLSGQYSSDLGEPSRLPASRSAAVDIRWSVIDKKVTELWTPDDHWKLARSTDPLGRRMILVRNRRYSDHQRASYDRLTVKEPDEQENQETLRRKKELSELMKRNSDAFVPLGDDIEEEDRDTGDGNDDAQNTEERIEADAGEGLGGSAYFESDYDTTVADEIDGLVVPDATTDLGETPDDDAWAKAFIWSDNESVVARFDSAMIVTLQYTVEGRLVLTTHGLYFHQSGEEINVVTKQPVKSARPATIEGNDRRWRLCRLTEVHGRRYMLRAQALELFFSGSHELFINFQGGHKERNRFYAKLRNSCRVPMLFSPKSLNPRTIFKQSKLTELWKKRRISNFEYIMELNRMAGRTFNDIAQYPVFPWVLSDYTSDKIDLADSRVYRDLSKPVGALNPDRLSQLLERYNELEQFGFAENERFLFGSHYSSPGVILHYMIRQEPFTSMAIDLQSGRFDCPDRLFFDVSESWKSCNTSSSDVKELIPEFFTTPEIFLNSSKLPLGHTQKGHHVDDVGLPAWCKGSAFEFVRLNRLALESEYVSRNLHHWVDLIFGYKQRGAHAEAAHNIFHHLSYEGAVDLDKISDELDRKAAESHIQNFGQTPSQLIVKEPHPTRCSAEDSWAPLINNLSSMVRLRCHTPAKQFGGKKGGCGSAIKILVDAESLTVIYSDLKVGSFKWSPKASSNRLKPEKLKTLPTRGHSNSRAVIKRGSAAPQTMDDYTSRLSVGNWCFAVTLGGYEKEQLRRKRLMPSRLATAKDALYTEGASLIVSCGYWDNSLKVHSTDNWKLESSVSGGHRGPIRCLAVGNDGGLMVTGGQDCTCRVWVVDHPDMAVALSDGYVQTALGQTTDGDQVLSCCHVLWGHDSPISCLAVSSEVDIVASGSTGGDVCLHSIRRGDRIRKIRPPVKNGVSPVSKVALDNHGRMVVHMGDGGLHTYTINGVLLRSADAGEHLHDMLITGEVLVTGGERCHVYIRDLTTLKVLSGLDLSRHGPVRCITVTPDELNPVQQHLFIGSDDGMISIVDRED